MERRRKNWTQHRGGGESDDDYENVSLILASARLLRDNKNHENSGEKTFLLVTSIFTYTLQVVVSQFKYELACNYLAFFSACISHFEQKLNILRT